MGCIMPFLNIIGPVVIKLRQARSWSQEVLAARLQCQQADISRDVLANIDYMDKNLKSHGWNLITIDIQWYEPEAKSHDYRKDAVLAMDPFGRLLPAPNRFPSAVPGAGRAKKIPSATSTNAIAECGASVE